MHCMIGLSHLFAIVAHTTYIHVQILNQFHTTYAFAANNVDFKTTASSSSEMPSPSEMYKLRFKALSHGAIFLATCNAILILVDVKLANTRFHHSLLIYS